MLNLRRAFTLVEVLVAAVVGGAVLALLATVSARQQRLHRQLVLATGRAEQLQQTEALLPTDIRALAPGEGDIAPGGARDTALQFRATTLSGVVCDTAGRSVSLAPVTATGPVLVSSALLPSAGDTLWALAVSDTGEQWYALPISAVGADHGGCVIGGVDALAGAGTQLARTKLTLAASSAGPIPPPGTPARVTRPRRYSLYRSSDRKWYLGDREWNPSTAVFDGIQPVSGPFRPPTQAGIVFRYLDTLGDVVSSGTSTPRGIALVQVALRADSDDVNVGRSILQGETQAVLWIGIRDRIR